MRPITSLASSFLATVAIVLGLGFFASKIPVSAAAAIMDDRLPAERSVAETPAATNSGVVKTTGAGLHVEITGVRNNKGTVIVLVFDDAVAFAAYDYERAVAFAEIAAATGTVLAEFSDLGRGQYAVTLFHDENGDDDFNTDGMYPLEGYGTSGASGAYDEPTFDEASVDADRISVRMQYLR